MTHSKGHQCVLFLLLIISSSIKGYDTPSKCNCMSTCRSDVVVRNGKGCPHCPQCYPCPEPNSTMAPSSPCILPGYEFVSLVAPGISRCFKMGGSMSVHDDLSDSMCGPGAELATFNGPSEVEAVQAWAWDQLGSQHVGIWTGGKGYAGGYKWRSTDISTILLNTYSWHTNPPPDNTYCIRICTVLNRLDYDSCSMMGLHYLCQDEASP